MTLASFNSRLKDLKGPVTRINKKKKTALERAGHNVKGYNVKGVKDLCLGPRPDSGHGPLNAPNSLERGSLRRNIASGR